MSRLPADPLTEQILDAAREQFTTFGLRRSTVDDVAKRAGVSRVTVYRRFGNKDGLVSACLIREYRRFVMDVDATVVACPPWRTGWSRGSSWCSSTSGNTR